MSNKLIKTISPKDTLRAFYLRRLGFYHFSFELDNGTNHETLRTPVFDFTGLKMQRKVEQLATKLQCYGIQRQDIEKVIIEACKRAKTKPPKYLR